jgi:uncharacterized protein YndB with AHSA1/START domain
MTAPPAGRVLELTRVLDAPRERIFTALTDPAELGEWWGPHGFTTPRVELDLAVGGRYRFTMQPPDGEAFHLAGEFREVEPPNRLAYTFRWEPPDPDDCETVVALSLRSTGEWTELTLRQGDFATEARLELHRSGWTDSLDRLGRLLASGA